MNQSLDLISVGRISLDFYANESNVGFKDVKTFSMSIGGSPTNVAIASARLGNSSAVATNIGRDAFTEYILGKLTEFKVDTRYVGIDESQFSPAVFAAMDDPFNPTIFFNRSPEAPDTKIKRDRIADAEIKSTKVFWVSACALATGETAKSIQDWLVTRSLSGHTDAFGGMLVHGLKNSWPLEKIGNYANAAGAIVASRLLCSDAMPTLNEVENLVKGVGK
ncbi:MAG: hypothetical protein EB134_01825 [Actinobacteria bacterium]|nr:hypothetical protein [Actinomycetota bacterium]